VSRARRDRAPQIVIVGAGFAGIGLAVLLKRADIDSFTIYEKATGVGGAWWHNVYPGAEVDTHSCVYSFPFKPYPWTRSHARQPEVQRYLAETVADFSSASVSTPRYGTSGRTPIRCDSTRARR
jgi:cation diffusion facilitator CzcD-associated flavoprotein CzcO